MEEGNKSQEELHPLPSESTQATSEAQPQTKREEALHERSSTSESPPCISDTMKLVSDSRAALALPSFSNHHQQQQFHTQFHSFHTEGFHPESQLHHYYAQCESMNSSQYYPPLQGHLHSSFQDEQESLIHHQHHQQQQQLLLHQLHSTSLQSNYFSTPRNECTIHVAAGKSPTENMNLARKFLIHHEIVYLSAFDAAIVIAIDAALLIQRSKYATIVRVETDAEDRVEMQQQHHNWDSPTFASIVKRPKIKITVKRSEEFVQWLTENKNDLNEH